MLVRILVPLVLAAAAVPAAGCGGGRAPSTGANHGEPNGGGVNGISVGNCLNEDENFLVQPSRHRLDGQSPGGVNFTLTLYPTPAAARAAAAKKNPKTTAVVENGVVDFKGNPAPVPGAPAPRISRGELASIRRCIDKAPSQ